MKKPTATTTSGITNVLSSTNFSSESLSMMDELYSHSPTIVEEFRSIQNQQFEIFCRKQLSYGKGNIMLGGNIDSSDDRVGALRGIVIRLNDKLQRLINIVLKGNSNPLKDESVRDTFLDLSVYGIIALIVDNQRWK
jgi:hypothetical protein